MKQYIGGILLVLLPLCVLGQNDSVPVQLEQVVVTATLHAAARSEVPAVVDVIGKEQLQAENAVNLAEGLTLSPGLRVENTCQNCGSNQLRISGLAGQYTQILIDSRPVVGPLAGVYFIEMMPASMIDRIEVMRGGGSALFGGGAMAGVVNVITREPMSNQATASSQLRWLGNGSFDQVSQLSASVVNNAHSAGVSLFGNLRSRSPYDRDGDGFSELSRLKNHSIGARAYFLTGGFGKLNVEYHHLYEFRRGGDCFDLPSPWAHISEGGEHEVHSGQVAWNLFSADGLAQLSLYATASYVDRESYYGARADDEPIGQSYGYTTSLTTAEGMRYSRSFSRLLFMPATLTAGLEHTYDGHSDRNLFSTDTLRQHVGVWSAFAQNEWRTYRWTVLAGVRVDRHSQLDHLVVSPRLNVRFAPSDHLVLRLGYSSGFRAPQVYDEDLHVGAVGGELYHIANVSDLLPERSHSLTASADLCFHVGKVDVDLLAEGFFTQIDDVFALVWDGDEGMDGVRNYIRCNVEGARVAGVNVEARLQPMPHFDCRAGATIQLSRYLGQGLEYAPERFEQRMERSPERYGFFALEYSPWKRLTFSVRTTITGPMLVYHAVEEDVLPVTTPTFCDMGLGVEYAVPLTERAEMRLRFGVQNLFDAYQSDLDRGWERDSKYVYGPSMPRTVYAGVQIDL